MAKKLTDGYTVNAKNEVEIDPDVVYPAILAELKAKGYDLAPDKPDQYWVEVAYQFAKLDGQLLIQAHKLDTSRLRIKRCDKWAMSKFVRGRGLEAATFGKEARQIYKEVRGL